MKSRTIWLKRLEQMATESPLFILNGVRDVGKGQLISSIPNAVTFHCKRPSDRKAINQIDTDHINTQKLYVFTDLHYLDDPSSFFQSLLLQCPKISCLLVSPTPKLQDELSTYFGELPCLTLSPLLWQECEDHALEKRFRLGGLPGLVHDKTNAEDFYVNWAETLLNKDVPLILSIRNHQGLQSVYHTVMPLCGQGIDHAVVSRQTSVTRPTVKTHLHLLAKTGAIHLIPPFHQKGNREVTNRNKVYACDTGLLNYHREAPYFDWNTKRIFWEHLVLNELQFACPDRDICYWKNKDQRVVDFVLPKGDRQDLIFCELDVEDFNTQSLDSFRKKYPHGENIVVIPDPEADYLRFFGLHEVTILGTKYLGEYLSES